MQIKLFFFRTLFFLIAALLNYLGADIRTEHLCSKPVPAPKGLGRGANANEAVFFRTPFFSITALLNYLGAGIRTERFRSKPVPSPKALGRGANAN